MRGMPAAPLLASLSPMSYNPIDRLTLGITPAGLVVLIPHLLHQAVVVDDRFIGLPINRPINHRFFPDHRTMNFT